MINREQNPVEWSLLMYELSDLIEHLQKLESQMSENSSIDEIDYKIQISHIYSHLNTAWNSRNRTHEAEDEDYEKESKFPTDNASIFSEIKNKLLCYIHDDGWYLKLYYSTWSDVEGLLQAVIPMLGVNANIIQEIQIGEDAFWIAHGNSEHCSKTYDLDSILKDKLN